MPSLTDAYAKLERADEHIRGVHEQAQQICNAQAEATKIHIPIKQTIKPGEIKQICAVKSANTPIPERLTILTGDTVNSLRSCLDYLIGELAELDSGNRKPRTQFPIENSTEAFYGQRNRFLNGVNDVHTSHIETLQPYNGTMWIANLSHMSNWDKHNKLILVAHDYIVSGTITKNKTSSSGEASLQQEIYVQPSLRIQLENGLPLIETLDEIRSGVANTLDHFSTEFETT